MIYGIIDLPKTPHILPGYVLGRGKVQLGKVLYLPSPGQSPVTFHTLEIYEGQGEAVLF
jgi:hypothetical protein